MNLEQFRNSKKGKAIDIIIENDDHISEMIAKSEMGRPALEAIGLPIENVVGSLSNHEKKLVGRWVKEVIASYGWFPDRKGRVAKGHFFRRGTIYRRFDNGSASTGQLAASRLPKNRLHNRLSAAQQRVTALPYPVMGADDLIRDRRAESTG